MLLLILLIVHYHIRYEPVSQEKQAWSLLRVFASRDTRWHIGWIQTACVRNVLVYYWQMLCGAKASENNMETKYSSRTKRIILLKFELVHRFSQ